MPDEYVIAIYNVIPGNVDPGGVHTLRDMLRSYLRSRGINDAQVKMRAEQRRIDVTLPKGLETALKEFEQSRKNEKLHVRLIFVDYKESASHQKPAPDLAEAYEKLQAKFQELSSSQKKLKERFEELKKKRRYEGQISELEKKASQGAEREVDIKTLHYNATPSDVYKVLEANEQTHKEAMLKAQEAVIASIFYPFLEEVERYELIRGEPGDLEKARKAVEEKALYLQRHGQKAVDDLPEGSKNSLLSSWSSAEKIIEEHNAVTFDMFVRIADLGGSYSVIIPVNPKSESQISQQLVNTLIDFGKNLESKHNIDYQYEDDEPFAMLKINGKIPQDSLESALEESFRSRAGNIHLKYIYTTFLGKIPQSYAELKKAKTSDEGSFKEFVSKRAKELGYNSLSRLARERGIHPYNISRLFVHEIKVKATDDTISKLAGIFETDVEEFRNFFKE
jgi:plasmid maintenance system antidote protein VapI/chaperonin cofactor prefoldin